MKRILCLGLVLCLLMGVATGCGSIMISSSLSDNGVNTAIPRITVRTVRAARIAAMMIHFFFI